MTAPRAVCALNMPNRDHFFGYVKANATQAPRMLTHGARAGQSVVICGAGPTLADHLHDLPDSDEVWGCNSAVPYLWDHEVRLTHGITIDQGPEMLGEREWGRVFPRLTYYVASSINPKLTAHLRRHKARVRWFHSYLGIDDPPDWKRAEPQESHELWLYRHRFPTSVMVGHGLNTVPRAVCLALALGFSDIAVYGADCCCAPMTERMPPRDTPEYVAWMQAARFYADGTSAGWFGDTPMAEAAFDGRYWHTRPDMVISAMHLLDLEREHAGRVRLMGDTLPNALRDKPPEFLAEMPKLDKEGQVLNFGVAA